MSKDFSVCSFLIPVRWDHEWQFRSVIRALTKREKLSQKMRLLKNVATILLRKMSRVETKIYPVLIKHPLPC